MTRAIFCAAFGAAIFFTATIALADPPPDAGTTVTVQVADGGDTTVAVTHGELKVKAAGEETHVKAGQGVRARRGEKAKRISLLPAPSSVTPEDGAHVNTLDVRLSWEPIAGASGYHVVVAADENFTRLLYDSARPDANARARVKAAGTYYWRIACTDGELEGAVSPARRFVVDVTPPKLKAGKPKWR